MSVNRLWNQNILLWIQWKKQNCGCWRMPLPKSTPEGLYSEFTWIYLNYPPKKAPNLVWNLDTPAGGRAWKVPYKQNSDLFSLQLAQRSLHIHDRPSPCAPTLSFSFNFLSQQAGLWLPASLHWEASVLTWCYYAFVFVESHPQEDGLQFAYIKAFSPTTRL